MQKLTDLRFVFTLVAVIEAVYAVAGLVLPPSVIHVVPGWSLTPDGHWLAKLMGMALASQALVAWWLRKEPPPRIALALGLYQVGAATIDWVMLLALQDQGIFPIEVGRYSV